MIGEIVGNFRVVGKLGKGGMGEVWLGEHKEIKTKVAIKVLAEDISTDRQHVDRFFNEAVAVSKIKHSGIVKIFDSGYHESGRAYLIMELLEGESLGARVKRVGRLPLAQLAELGRQIASVLEATHAEGIVHRDLKPDNVFFVKDHELAGGERVKVLDFGIAKLGDATGMTGTGGSMGTPGYMPPEQWKASGKVGPRADSYAFGCLAFEAACGRPPFMASSVGEACHMHLHDTPPTAKTLVGTLPDVLDTLLARLLAKDPDQRPAMSEVKAVFANLVISQTPGLDATLPGASASIPLPISVPLDTTLGAGAGMVAPAPQPAKPRSKLPLLLAVGGVAIAGVAAVIVLRGRGGPGPESAAGGANKWIAIDPPATRVVLGLSAEDAPVWIKGFRPSRNVVAPSEKFAIQEHEVTWAEFEPWLATHPEAKVDIPPWAKDPATRAKLPVAGVSWETARDYCKSEHGGTLPSEAQWEYAARGAERRPNPWGSDRLDLMRTTAFGGANATPQPASSSDQDITPNGIHDLAGNVQEWMSDLWRGDVASDQDHKSQDAATQTTIRAIRGLTLWGAPPERPANAPPANDSASFREPLCATGNCDDKAKQHLAYVGFRCVRAAPP